jgi:hypothetical protein
MSDTRIYVVNDGQKKRLIRAPNQAQAVRHAAKDFKADVASQDDLCELIGAGVKVEQCTNGGEGSGS